MAGYCPNATALNRPGLCGSLRRIARGRATLTSPGVFDNRCVRLGGDEPLDDSDAS
jgi:hypothetical protein